MIENFSSHHDRVPLVGEFLLMKRLQFNLAVNTEPEEGSVSTQVIENVGQVWQEAIDLGIASGSTDGAMVPNKAKQYLADLLERKETS